MNSQRTIFLHLFLSSFLINVVIGQNSRYQVEGIGPDINSGYDEQAPVLSPDGSRLYFTIAKHPENTGGTKDPGDIWITEKDTSGNWKTPFNAGKTLNNRQYNAVIGFTKDGETVYLSGHYLPGDKRPKTKGISMSRYNNGNWTFPEPVDIPYFRDYSEQQSGGISYDGNIMLLAIESYNTRGAEDIYVSFRKTDGTWTDVRNLGSSINTEYQEKTPFLSADNKTLFFSSNGFSGHGSMDLYTSKRLDDTWNNWSTPVNLGAPVNTKGRELYYFVVPGSDRVLFCSTQNSDGYGDIKFFMLMPENVIQPVEETIIAVEPEIRETLEETNMLVVQGKVFNAENNNPLEAVVSFFSEDEEAITSVTTESGNGGFQFEISADHDFMIRVGAKGYMNIEEAINISTLDQNLILKNYYLEPLEVGKVFKLNNVLFQRATADLIDSSYVELDVVYRMMDENPDISIELSGHTDNVGNAKKNIELSQQRVEVVKQYLVDKGIEESRIAGKGYGGGKPIASNRTEETRRLNRRVEFKIVEGEIP